MGTRMHRFYRRPLTVTLIGLVAALGLLGVSVHVAAQAAPVAAAFAQQVSAHVPKATSLPVTLPGAVVSGNRIVVEVGVWNTSRATASAVRDAAGNTYTELLHSVASDGTELSVWTAVVTAGGGTRPAITATVTSAADVGVAAVEYSGLSSAAGAAAVDQVVQATGTTGAAAAVVSSGPTGATTAAGELAVGFYTDSGFSTALTAGAGYGQRVNVSPASDVQELVEDQSVGSGVMPAATVGTGARTTWLMATVVFKAGGPVAPPTAPAAPTGVSATPGNGTATVSWAAPADGGSALTSYTVTPFAGTTALASTVVTGTPPVTSATMGGLTNGTAYTFTVSAANAVGPGPASAASAPVTPVVSAPMGLVQQVSTHVPKGTSVPVTLPGAVTAGNRIVVEVGVWNSSRATTSGVRDAAGNTYTELSHPVASDGTELSVWTAVVAAGGGTRPAITATVTSAADVGVAAVEYTGLSSAAGAAAVDQLVAATGTTGAAGAVSSGATAATTAAGELALGFYADSGFSTALSVGAGFTQRVNVSPASDMQLLVEDQPAASGAKPAASAGTGAQTTWVMATVVFKPGGPAAPATAPAAPTGVTGVPGNASATVSWSAPADGGSALTSYTVTPFAGSTALASTTVTGAPPAASATIGGLTNGTAYTFTVTATNAVGTSAASIASAPVTPAVATGGQWGTTMNWPFVAVHAVALKDGRYLLWDGWQRPEPTYVWDPASGTFTTVNAASSIFCDGNALLPDGRVLSVGGYGVGLTGTLGIKDTNIFDPATTTWNRVADMNQPRWYPSLTQLTDGRYVAISGNSADANTWADTPEVYDPAANTWTPLPGVNTSQVHEEEYPFSYLTPSGKVFTIGPSEDRSFLLDVPAQSWTPTGGASGVVNGSSVMYRPGKILYSGGAADLLSAPSRAGTAVIDLTAATPAWRKTADMNNARTYHTLTALADGTVLAVGGEGTADQTVVNSGVLPAEIWDPATERWTPVAPMANARNYHSTAILMADGRVLVSGGGHFANSNGPGQFNAQIYSPPYLFAGARPTITSAPQSTTYGATMAIATPNAADIRSVNLVSLGADTHQSDMDQHFVPLSFTAGAGGLTVSAPAGPALAPAGNYMVFLVNSAGVPSVATMVQMVPTLTAPAAPGSVSTIPGNGSATVGWTPAGDGGSPVTSYTVTPYVGATAQPATVVTGTPPATSTTVTGLTNGTAYTFTVTATNSVGTSPPSAPSGPVTPAVTPAPAFVQQASAHVISATSVPVTLPAAVTGGDRLVVEVAVWNNTGGTASGVRDSAGNVYTQVKAFTASDGAQMSVWTAPITAGGATKPTITATVTSSGDVGVAAEEYRGLSTAAGAAAVDQTAQATGTTGASAASVASGATPATTGKGLAVGFYGDSGFNAALTPGAGFTQRTNVSPFGDIQMLVEDQQVAAGAVPNATVGTGSRTIWLMGTVVFKAA